MSAPKFPRAQGPKNALLAHPNNRISSNPPMSKYQRRGGQQAKCPNVMKPSHQPSGSNTMAYSKLRPPFPPNPPGRQGGMQAQYSNAAKYNSGQQALSSVQTNQTQSHLFPDASGWQGNFARQQNHGNNHFQLQNQPHYQTFETQPFQEAQYHVRTDPVNQQWTPQKFHQMQQNMDPTAVPYGGGLPEQATPQYGQSAWGNPAMPPTGHDHNQGFGMRPAENFNSNTTFTPTAYQQQENSLYPIARSLFPTSKCDNTSNKTSVNSNTKPGTESFQVKSKSSVNNISLRCLVSTIQGIKHWSKYKNKVPLIFETVASIGSAVSSNANGITKQFVLKDGKDEISAVFYETDRSMPLLAPGKWYRLTGDLESRNGQFRCVSVRPALDIEKKLHMTRVKASDKAMRDFISNPPKNQ